MASWVIPQFSYPALELIALPPQLLKRFSLIQRTLTLMKSIPVRLLAERPAKKEETCSQSDVTHQIDRTYTVVWLTLFLDPIDPKHTSM
jgi:hypothetical protein